MSKVLICGVDTSALPKLNREESEKLLKKIKKGDVEAKEKFITCNLRLVLSIIKRFNGAKASLDDMFQAGCIGLIKSVDNFNLEVGVTFSTYAVPMIIGEIKRLLRGGNSLRVPRSLRDEAYQVLKTRVELEKKEDFVTTYDIANKLGIAEREVAYCLDALSDTVSIYDPVYSKEGDELLLVDQISDEKNTIDKWTENTALDVAVTGLDDRARKILFMRYYEGRTQTEISKEVGLSQAQVSRLEKTALREIKEKMS